MKPKRQKRGRTTVTKYKIPLLLTIILSSILFVSIILFSILQTNTKPNLPNPDEIKIYKQSTSADATHKKGTDEYNKLIDLYNSMKEFIKNPENIPSKKWYHFPMENLSKLKKQNEASFMIRMYQSRNLMIYFSMILALAILIDLVM